VSGATHNDILELLPLVDAIPPVRGKRGRPRRRPKRLLGDGAYHSRRHRRELVAITHQIDKAGTELVALKTESAERTNAIVPSLDRFLGKEARMKARWSADGDFVFSARQGNPVEYRNLRRALAVAAEEAGLGHVRPHDLRHTFTSNLLQNADLATASRYVGHKNVQVTAKIYAHAIGSDAEQAARVAEAMRVAGLGH
jgi:integrase